MFLVRAAVAFFLLTMPFVCAAETPAAHAIDFTVILKDLDGKPMVNGDPKDPKPLSLSDVAIVALEATLEEDNKAGGQAKFDHDQLARKVHNKASVVLTAEEIALLKERIGKAWGALVVGQAWRLLDPAVAKTHETP